MTVFALYFVATFSLGIAIGMTISFVLLASRIADIRTLILHVVGNGFANSTPKRSECSSPGLRSISTTRVRPKVFGSTTGA